MGAEVELQEVEVEAEVEAEVEVEGATIDANFSGRGSCDINRIQSNMSVRGSLDFELTNTDNKGICVAFAGYILAMSFIWNGATMEDNAGGPDYEDIGIDDQCKDYVVVLIFLLL